MSDTVKKYKIVNFNFCIFMSLVIISLLITHNKERDATAADGMSKKPKLLIHNPIGPIDILNAYPGLPEENDCIT